RGASRGGYPWRASPAMWPTAGRWPSATRLSSGARAYPSTKWRATPAPAPTNCSPACRRGCDDSTKADSPAVYRCPGGFAADDACGYSALPAVGRKSAASSASDIEPRQAPGRLRLPLFGPTAVGRKPPPGTWSAASSAANPLSALRPQLLPHVHQHLAVVVVAPLIPPA